MNSAQEKALWDFVRDIAAAIEETPRFRVPLFLLGSSRALLSVLAEEAPPVKEPRCTCNINIAGYSHYHATDCPLWATAPAPKQERGVEEILASALGQAADYMEGRAERINTTMLRAALEKGLRLYREERIASERQASSLAEHLAFVSNKWGESEAENASLRERVAQYKSGEEMNGALAAERIDRIHRALARLRETQPYHSAIKILEGKGEGTEATK